MTLYTPVKSLAVAVICTMLLSACGGSDGGSASANTTPPKPTPSEPTAPNPPVSKPDATKPITPKPPAQNTQPSGASEINMAQLESKNHKNSALVGSNTISLARQSCQLSGLSEDAALTGIAVQHANYIQYVLAKSAPTGFNVHRQDLLAGSESVSGKNNPFFSGLDFEKRLVAANYPKNYAATENISRSTHYHSLAKVIAPDYAAQAMVKSLLAAPYHLKSLMTPNLAVTGSSLVSYMPYGKDTAKSRGYVFVNHAAATKTTQNAAVKGVFTYPCDKVTGTNTALYNESPNPVQGTGRDLATDPIGQPIYINMPSATHIKVSNIKFTDKARGFDVPVSVLDAEQDPHKGTNYKMLNNEAFILPLTDALKSCEVGNKKGKNCGLYGNSEYEVSFDLLVDNKTLLNKHFTFKTGAVNY